MGTSKKSAKNSNKKKTKASASKVGAKAKPKAIKGAKAAKAAKTAKAASSSGKVAAKVASFVKEKILGKKGAAPAAAKPIPKGAKPLKAVPVVPAAPVATKAPKGRGRAASSISAAGVHLAPESVCREVACEGLATTGGYCRMHYIKNWKKIKRKEVILREKKLNQYIEELVVKYPDKYIEAIRQDLASDKDFAKVIYDLDLDESVDDFEVEGEGDENLIDNIKREIDDEGEGF